MSNTFFPEVKNLSPKIYAFSDSHEQYKNLLKIGYTTQDVSDRVKQQYPTLSPGEPTYKIMLDEQAIRNDGSTFTDKDVHRFLKKKNFLNPKGEWFKCNVDDVRSALHVLKTGNLDQEGRPNNFAKAFVLFFFIGKLLFFLLRQILIISFFLSLFY